MATLVHLVRHGEVENPDHLVYASLPGFSLSERGRRQAAASGLRLASRPIDAIVSSPLERAVETAKLLAAPHGVTVTTDPELIEWRLADRWAGLAWEDLPHRRPGELEAYLADPTNLPFSPESLEELAERIVGAILRHAEAVAGELVVVGHQDPLHAAIRRLTGRGFASFGEDKPAHATVVTLAPTDRDASPWQVVDRWDPPDQAAFPPPP